jgi:hypothetical protein
MDDPQWLGVAGAAAVVIVVTIVGLVLHEVGHALAAHAMGFRVRVVRTGPLAATATPAGWRLRLTWRRSRDGWVLADPVRPERLRARHAVFVAAGPAAHLVVAGAMVAAARAWGGAWVLAAILLLLTVGFNLVPLGLRREGRWLDGDWLLAWSLRPRLATQRVALGALGLAMERGERPRDWDERWARLASLEGRRRECGAEVHGDMLAYLWALDRGQVDDAGRLLGRAFAGRRLLPDGHCAGILVAAAFFVARHRGRRALATRLVAAASPRSDGVTAAGLELAGAAIHLAAGEHDEAAAASDRTLSLLDGSPATAAGLRAMDRDLASALRDAALSGAQGRKAIV